MYDLHYNFEYFGESCNIIEKFPGFLSKMREILVIFFLLLSKMYTYENIGGKCVKKVGEL